MTKLRGKIMQILQFSKRNKQVLLTLFFLVAIISTFFATRAWAMEAKSPPAPPIKTSQYEVFLEAKPIYKATTTTTTSTTPTTTAHTMPSKPVETISTPTVAEPIETPLESIWDELAECESGGDWAYNGGSGFDGGLQFSPATWTRLHTHWGANTGYEFAWQAPREVQIQVAILNMQVSSGAHSQWPVCSKKVGMPNKF